MAARARAGAQRKAKAEGNRKQAENEEKGGGKTAGTRETEKVTQCRHKVPPVAAAMYLHHREGPVTMGTVPSVELHHEQS